MRAILVVLALVSMPVAADEGELSVAAAAEVEGATLEHPLVAAPSRLPPISLVPHLAVGVRYSVTNELQLGVALNFGGTGGVQSTNVTLGGTTTRLVTGTYAELGAPANIGWRLDSGHDVSASAALELGPVLALWLATAATDPSTPASAGLPRRLPLEIADAAVPGLGARLLASADARFLDVVGLRLGAFAGAGWIGGPVLSFGVSVEASWATSPGPA